MTKDNPGWEGMKVACSGKIAYKYKRALARRDQYAVKGITLYIYNCQVCGKYHVSHKEPRNG